MIGYFLGFVRLGRLDFLGSDRTLGFAAALALVNTPPMLFYASEHLRRLEWRQGRLCRSD